MTTVNLQEEKNGNYLPITQLTNTPPPLPWWVLFYFSDYEVFGQNDTWVDLRTDFIGYIIRYNSFKSYWELIAYFIQNEDADTTPMDTPIFYFPIPPTEEKFRAVMQALDIQ